MRRGVAAVRARLLLVKHRLHDEIMAGDSDDAKEAAYMQCCLKLGRLNQMLGNLEGIASRVQ